MSLRLLSYHFSLFFCFFLSLRLSFLLSPLSFAFFRKKYCSHKLTLVHFTFPLRRPPPLPLLVNVFQQALKDTEYKGWKTRVLDATFPVSSGPEGLMEALDQICMESSEALRGGECQV